MILRVGCKTRRAFNQPLKMLDNVQGSRNIPMFIRAAVVGANNITYAFKGYYLLGLTKEIKVQL